MNGEIETVEVTLKLPKGVAAHFSDGEKPLEDRLTEELVEVCFAQIESTNAETLMARFNLKPVFKEFGVLPIYYKEAEKHE